MKKWISFMMILFLAVIFVGCGDKPDNPDPKPDDPTEIKVTSIEVTGVKEELEEGESFTLEIKILPENATNKNYRVAAVDTSVLKVEDKKVTALKGGETTLTVTPLGNTQLKKEFKITVKGKEAPVVEPTKIILSGGTEVQVGKLLSLTVSVEPENASKAVLWSSSDETKATVNEKGMIIGVAVGEVTITATSKLNENVKTEYKINVVPKENVGPIKVDPTGIEVILSSDEIEAGYSVTARATVQPNGADQNVTWESTKPEVATIDENGKIKALSEGTTYIRAYSKVDPTIKSSPVKLKVKPEPTPIQPADLKGYEILLMNADSALADLDPFLDGYNGNDKAYKQKAWREIESEYNCTIKVVAYPADAPWGASRYNWINSQAEIGASQADFAVITSSWLNKVAGVGSAHDAKTYYNKYGRNQMTITQKQAATYKGGLYALSTGSDDSRSYADLGLYYNVAWVERLKVDSPAKLFNEGNWTYSGFVSWANQVQALLGEGEVALAGKLYYYWLGMTNTTGVKIADTTSVKVTLDSPRQKAAVDTLQSLVATGALATTSSWMEAEGEFFEKKCVMTAGWWWFVKASNRWTSDLFGEDTRYGYVPFPYPDDMSKDQIRVAEYGTSLLVFLAGRDSVHPAGVTYEGIYQAMTDLYLRTNKYYQDDPAYDPDTIKHNTIASKIDDPESVEAATFWDASKVFYDAVQDFYDSTSGSPLTTAADNIIKGSDYQQTMDGLESSYIQTFLQIYSGN